MKKLFAIFAFALAAAFTASAQGLPKTEFQVLGFGGYSGVMYTIDGVNFLVQPNDANKDIKSKIGLGGGAGFGFNYNFAPHWGILTGVEGAFYQAELKSDFLNFGYVEGAGIAQPGANSTVTRFVFADFKESQKIMSLQIPLMVQFNAALNKQHSIHWYIAAGAKLALNLKGSYNLEMKSWMYQPYAVQPQLYDTAFTYGNQYDYSNENYVHSWKDRKLDVELINALASIETGFRFKLGESVGLYLGAYLDYGLMRVAKAKKQKLVKNNDNWQTMDNINPQRPAVDGIIINEDALTSVLNAQSTDYVKFVPRPDPDPNMYGPSLDYRTSSKPLAEGANLASAGLKIRLSFGRHSPKVAPAPVAAEPQIIYVPQKADTVTVEKIVVQKDTVTVTNTVVQKDTVTVEKVVRDTVIIIKEVPVEIQKVMKDLSNTLFKFNKFNLGETEKGYLDQVADWIKSEPEINVEIGGHTDSVGSDSYNQKLSEQRAKAVCDYLISQGVDKARLSYKGYGESEPIATNETEAGRQRNRRVELKILQ